MRTFRIRPEVVAVAALLVIAGCVATEVAQKPPAEAAGQTVKIVAKRFDFTPEQVTLKKGVPVDLELTTEDRLHGFNVPVLGLHAQIVPGQTTHVRFTPDKAGRYVMSCDVFCGEGHESMDATIVVVE
jgi:cytochrome c oxidase subunit 2